MENQSRFEIQEILLFVSENRLFDVPSVDSSSLNSSDALAKNTSRKLEVCS